MKLVPENLSPNITLHIPEIINSDYYWSPNIEPNITLHERGIIEIDTYQNIFHCIESAGRTYEQKGHSYPVGFNGLKDPNEKVGSHRVCLQSKELAVTLTKALDQTGLFQLDNNGRVFKNVSQYFRLMNYVKGGEHAPHYDSDYRFPYQTYATRYSLVLYLTNCNTGEIYFCNDNRDPQDKSDWDRAATEDEIYLKIKPREGKIVIFPHHLCHGVAPYTDKGGKRIIVRGDLIYQDPS